MSATADLNTQCCCTRSQAPACERGLGSSSFPERDKQELDGQGSQAGSLGTSPNITLHGPDFGIPAEMTAFLYRPDLQNMRRRSYLSQTNRRQS